MTCGGEDPPAEPAEPVVAESFDHAAESLPDDDALPDDFAPHFRCPGDDLCEESDQFDWSAVGANQQHFMLDDEDPIWETTNGFVIAVRYFADVEAAQQWYDDFVDELREFASGDFDIPAEAGDANSFQMGQAGSGQVDDYEVDGWGGVGAERIVELSRPDGLISLPRQEAEIVLILDQTVLTCRSTRYADDGDRASWEDCDAAVTDYFERLAGAAPDDVPPVGAGG